MSEENKALIRRYIRAVDDADGDYEVVEQFLAPDFVTHNPVPGAATDREGIKQFSEIFFNAATGGHHAIKMQIPKAISLPRSSSGTAPRPANCQASRPPARKWRRGHCDSSGERPEDRRALAGQ
jgi:hypothetical protein